MKPKRLMVSICVVWVGLILACSLSGAPTSPAVVATQSTAVSQNTSAQPVAALTASPLDLAGPPMKVGSSYLYFDGSLLVAVPGGPFLMGHGGSDNPEHTVTLGDFWIYATKVTDREYQRCVAVGKCTMPDLDDNQGYNDPVRQNDPVSGVTYDQGAAYCDYAHGSLPTEAQWEKTARGPNGNIYPWGNSAPSADLLNYNSNVGRTTNVNAYPKGKSYYDALDMEGNVYEWVHDWYNESYYGVGPAQDPLGPDTGQDRSVRSSGYHSTSDQVPASTRFHKLPIDHARDLGFRCMVINPAFFAPMCQVSTLVGSNPGGNPAPVSGVPTPQTLNISVNYSGCGKNSIAVVTFNDSLNPDPNLSITNPVPASCSVNPAGGHVAQWTCMGAAGVVKMTSSCVYSTPMTASCPAHYNLNAGICVWDGSGASGGQCPAGTVYDPLNKCCTLAPGAGANFWACPAGTFFQDMGGGSYQCLPAGGACYVNPATASVQDPVALQGQCGGKPGGSCALNASICASKKYGFNATLCCCTYPKNGSCVK
jgi:formylglycine-generating enzyme required for sulfatase activity